MTRPLSSLLLDGFRRLHIDRHAQEISLTLRPAYLDLLRDLGAPQLHLPPVLHVAGTNGKGSTCAFLRACFEAAGYRVHVYTSPHLVAFHERIRLAGRLIAEEELAAILSQCAALAPPGAISPFEAATAAALTAFARHKADIAIMEVGLGGRLDATNVLEAPLATLITRLSYDHRDYLGDSMAEIAAEKAGIMRRGVPCYAAAQPDAEAAATLKARAAATGAPLHMAGVDWEIAPQPGGWRFRDRTRDLILPLPALAGRHQLDNAGLAIAALAALPQPLPEAALREGMRQVTWPARLQRLEAGRLAAALPAGWELWLDGGHNDSAGEALAAQAAAWKAADAKPLYLILGMLGSKAPQEFLAPLAPYIKAMRCTGIASDDPLPVAPYPPEALALRASALGLAALPSAGIAAAIADLARLPAGRILICGSLYLAGQALRDNGAAPA